MAMVVRVLVGLFVLGVGVECIYVCVALWTWGVWLPTKIVLTIILPLVSIIVLDSGLGLVNTRSAEVELYTYENRDPHQTLVIPGFNGVGHKLVDVIERNGSNMSLPVHGLVSFRPPYEGYDERAIADAFYEWWKAHEGVTKLNAYAESQGALIVIRLLLRHPDVRIDELILNAGITCNEDVLAPTPALTAVGALPGGPISTALARWKQSGDVRKSPQLAPGTDEETARAAERESAKLTTQMAFGQMWAIARAQKPQPNALAGRIGRVTYLRAPSSPDAFVRTTQAAANWRELVGPNTPFEEVEVPDFAPNLHTPTPEHPRPVVDAISKAAA